jgi:putative flippase GtrA
VRRFLRFLVAGGVAAGLNFGSRFILSIWFEYEIAVTISYVIGMCSGFVLMRIFVFDGRSRRIENQAAIFFLVNVVAFLQTLVVSVGLARWILPSLGFHYGLEGVAHFFGVLTPIVTSYFGHKLLTFK